ncbi:MAG: hypothetical protein ACK4WM_06410 [Thermoflexales bacterium]
MSELTPSSLHTSAMPSVSREEPFACVQQARAASAVNPSAGDRLFGGSLAFVAMRCTLRYIALPFALPLLGLSSGLSSLIALVIDAIALTTIALNIRRLWNTSWRWRYMGLGAVMTVIIAIMAWGDLQVLIP